MQNQSVVIDNGSYMTKIGFCGDQIPQSAFQTLIGKPKSNPGQKNYYVGSQMNLNSKLFCQFQPIEFGLILNWKGMENIWDYCFTNQLKIEPSQHECLITESPLNTQENREKTLTIMFEQFQVKRCSLAIQQVMSLYASGLTSGLVIDSGYEMTNIVPIIEGKILKPAISCNYIGGNDLTKYLQLQLTTSKSLQDKQIAKEIKETLCYTALDYQEQLQLSKGSSGQNQPFQLPDGKFITLQEELFKTSEILFQPKGIYGKESEGIQELAVQAIKKCEGGGIQSKLYSNINLVGGNSLFPGLQKRLQKEIINLSGNEIVKVFADDKRNISSWVGASMISQLESFKYQWISKEEFEEEGPVIVNKKCQ